MNFLAPLALALGLLAIPVILMYMLRLRRTEQVVSSTMLWEQVLRDREANAPWQRLRRNLLLLLQLLILAALVFALARPYSEVATFTAGRTALLIDASASMFATDVQPNRFAAARSRAHALVDALGANDSLSVIWVGNAPAVAAPYTSDRAVLHGALDKLNPVPAPPDWSAALTLAAAGFAGVEKFNIVIVSDGGLPAGLPAVPGSVTYVPIGQSDANTAILAMALAEDPIVGPELYAKLANMGGAETQTILSVSLDGTLYSANTYTLPANTTLDVTLTGLPKTFRIAQAALSRPAAAIVPDYLALDDTAYAVYDAGASGRALLVSNRTNRFLEQIFTSLPGWQIFRGDPAKPLPTDPYDLYIFDGVLPLTLPAANLLIVNPPANVPNLLFSITGKTAQPIKGGQARKDDARVSNVRFENVNIREVKLVGGAAWAQPLITAGDVPLLLAGEYNNHRVALLPFDLYDSDLPLQIAWPILTSDLAGWFRTPRMVEAANGLTAGGTLLLRTVPDADTIRVTRPDGALTTFRPNDARMVYTETLGAGVYSVQAYKGAALLAQEAFAVNLFSTLESRIAPAPQITVGSIAAQPAAPKETGQREYWPFVAVVALAVLMLEWIVYQRRQIGVRRSGRGGTGPGKARPLQKTPRAPV